MSESELTSKKRKAIEKSKETQDLDMELPKFKTTQEIKVSNKIIDQILGQDKAVEIVKKAAAQRRNVLLLGSPGTGKSMLAQGMAELMPAENLRDALAHPNEFDENNPKIITVTTYPHGLPSETASEEQRMGQGRRIIFTNKMKKHMPKKTGISPLLTILIILLAGLLIFQFVDISDLSSLEKYSSIIAAVILGGLFFLGMWLFLSKIQMGGRRDDLNEPKLIVDNTGRRTAPFIEATGAKAGALFGDVKHNPLQTGGLGTPSHLRVEAGAIHRADMGVLYVDEVGTLNPKSQQDLLTAMQEKKFSITGQSEMSSGALTRTEPVPCDFVLVAAGNLDDLQKMHPALRSRIRGYGYEIYLNDSMPDSKENREKLVRFVAQEVKKDGKIPHFTREAVIEIIKEAKRKAGRKHKLTLKFRELGGLIRAAGDIAKSENAGIVDIKHVLQAKGIAKTIEQQLSHQIIDARKEYSVIETSGRETGRVNGLAVFGDGSSGLIMPIVAEVTPASSKFEGKVIATGKLGDIAKEAVANVSAVIKKHMKRDVASYDIHIQFLQTYEGGVEGDSASISVALAVLSAMEEIQIKQDVAMTGSLSVRGEVLPVGGVTAKVEAALDGGVKEIIIPRQNIDDIVLSKDKFEKIRIIPVDNIIEVLDAALAPCQKKDRLIKRLKKEFGNKKI